jgi:hypothetical protein
MNQPKAQAEIAARREAMRQHEEELIAKVGWLVRGVGGSASSPSFAYTIGLYDKSLPELIVIGFCDERAMMLLNEVAQRLIVEPTLQGKIETEHWSMPFYLLDANKALCESGYTLGASERSDGEATYVQVVLPDRAGKFPWEDGCDAGFKAALPVLGTPRA